MRKSLEGHKKSGATDEKVMRKSQEIYEKVIRKSGESHEKVMRKSTTLLQMQTLKACLFLSVQLEVSHVLNSWQQGHGLPFRQKPW